MKKKNHVNLDIIFGYFLLIFGGFSASYVVITFIINIALVQTGFFLYVKDILFDLIFILLGLFFIRKKKSKIHLAQ